MKLQALIVLVSFEIHPKETSKIIYQSVIYFQYYSEFYAAVGHVTAKHPQPETLSYVPRQSPVGCWSQGPVYDPAVSNSDIVNVLCSNLVIWHGAA